MAEVTAARADPEELAATIQALALAEEARHEAQQRVSILVEENESLVVELQKAKREALDLVDERDTATAALHEWQRTMNMNSTKVPLSALGGGGGKAPLSGDAAVSKQMIQLRMSEADAQRRLRVAARAEMELRELLRRREARIEELKVEMKERIGASIAATKAAAVFKPAGASAGPGPGSGPSSGNAAGPSPASGNHPSTQQLASTAPLRAELARAKAQVEHLEASMAHLVATQRDPSVAEQHLAKRTVEAEETVKAAHRYRRECLRLHDAIGAAVSTAKATSSLTMGQGILLRVGQTAMDRMDRVATEDLSTATGQCIDALNVLMSGMLEALKDRDMAARQAQSRAKALEAKISSTRAEAYAAPLEASQRAVIRDLTARCNQLAHEKSQLRAARDRCQDRLEQLRNALGSHRGAGAGAGAAHRGGISPREEAEEARGGGAGRGRGGRGGRGERTLGVGPRAASPIPPRPGARTTTTNHTSRSATPPTGMRRPTSRRLSLTGDARDHHDNDHDHDDLEDLDEHERLIRDLLRRDDEGDADDTAGARVSIHVGDTDAFGGGSRAYRGRPEASADVVRQLVGLCDLLQAHMKVLESASDSVGAVARELTDVPAITSTTTATTATTTATATATATATDHADPITRTGTGTGTGTASGSATGGHAARLFVDRESRDQLVEGAARVASELASMRSTIRVLTSDCVQLLSGVPAEGTTNEGLVEEKSAVKDDDHDDDATSRRLLAQLEALESERARLEHDLASVRSSTSKEAESHAAALQDALEKATNLATDLDAVRAEAARWQSRCDELHQEVLALTAQRRSEDELLRQARAEARAEHAQEMAEAARLRLSLAKMEAALAGAEASKKELMTHAFRAGSLEGLPGGAGQAHATAALSARAAEAEARLEAAERAADTRLAATKTHVERLEGEVARVRAALERAEEEARNARRRADESAARLTEITGEAARTSAELQATEARRREADGKSQSRKLQLKQLKEKFAEVKTAFRDQITASNAQNAELTHTVESIQRQVRLLEDRLEENERVRVNLADDLAAERSRHHAQSSSQHQCESEYKDTIAQLEKKLLVLQQDLADTSRRADDAERRARQDAEAVRVALRDAEACVAQEKAQAEETVAAARREARETVERAQQEMSQRLSELEHRMEEERKAMRREADSRCSRAEQQGRGVGEVAVAEARARAAAAEAEAGQRVLRAEERAEELERTCRAYRAFREKEVRTLEDSLRQLILSNKGVGAGGAVGAVGTAIGEAQATTTTTITTHEDDKDNDGGVGVGAGSKEISFLGLLESDAVASAVRGAELSELRRAQTEQRLRSVQEELAQATTKLKAAQKDVKTVRDLTRQLKETRDREAELVAERSELKTQLERVGRESGRRLRALKEVSSSSAGQSPSVETTTRASSSSSSQAQAESALLLKDALSRKSAVEATLRERVRQLEEKLRVWTDGDWEGRVAVAEAKARQATQDAARKAQLLSQLRERMDALTKSAEERGALAEQGKAQSAVVKLQAQLQRRDAQHQGALAAQRERLAELQAGLRGLLAGRRLAREQAERAADVLARIDEVCAGVGGGSIRDLVHQLVAVGRE